MEPTLVTLDQQQLQQAIDRADALGAQLTKLISYGSVIALLLLIVIFFLAIGVPRRVR